MFEAIASFSRRIGSIGNSTGGMEGIQGSSDRANQGSIPHAALTHGRDRLDHCRNKNRRLQGLHTAQSSRSAHLELKAQTLLGTAHDAGMKVGRMSPDDS